MPRKQNASGFLSDNNKKETFGGGTSVPSKGFDTLILSHSLIDVNTLAFAINKNYFLNAGY